MKSPIVRVVALAALAGAFMLPALAQEEDVEAVVKQLFYGDWQDHLKKGKIELVASGRYDFLVDSGDEDHSAAIAIELETFPGENWEIELELKGLKYANSHDGDSDLDFGDVELAVEYRFLHLLDPLDMRISAFVEQPLSSADGGVNSGLREYGSKLSMRTKFGNLHFFASATWAWLERDSGHADDSHNELKYAAALFYPVGNWRPGLELYGETTKADGGDGHESYLIPQFRYQFDGEGKAFDDLEIAVGVPIGLTEDAADWGVSFQIYSGFDLRRGKSSTEEHFFGIGLD